MPKPPSFKVDMSDPQITKSMDVFITVPWPKESGDGGKFITHLFGNLQMDIAKWRKLKSIIVNIPALS